MKEHHLKAIQKATDRLHQEVPHLLAILLGGSIAKGIERDDSDVDLIVVVTDFDYGERLANNQLSFFWQDVCDYESGYVEGRFVSRSFIREAVVRGSQPTRHSFIGVSAISCTDKEILEWLPLIPEYSENHHQTIISAFLAQMQLNRWFFWSDAKRRDDYYLQIRSATEMVLFGCRLILAYNRILFACQKRLLEQTLSAPQKPVNLNEKINRLLKEMSDESKEDFCKTIEEFAEWGNCDLLSRFQQDVEMSWFTRIHDVSEW